MSELVLPALADQPFYEAILRGIGAPITTNTLASLYAWRQSEGGYATYNPFNTTHKLVGSTLYAKSSHGVQNYPTPLAGLEATLKTLTSGRYDAILASLREDQTPEQFASEVTSSPWGTGSLLHDVVAMFRRGRVVVAKIAEVPDAPAIATLASTEEEGDKQAVSDGGTNYWWALPVAAGFLTVGLFVYVVSREEK
jgi:hypothetical protein